MGFALFGLVRYRSWREPVFAGSTVSTDIEANAMKSYTAVIEHCAETGLYDELQRNLEEVIRMLLEDGEPVLEGEFAGTQTIHVS